MRRRGLLYLALLVSWTTMAAAAPARLARVEPTWPTLASQISKDRVPPGSRLDQLIRQNQDFGLLNPEESADSIPVPLWLRIAWRKAHPEMTYSTADPTGGYPHVLKEIHDWMRQHPSLEPGKAEEDIAPGGVTFETTVGTNVRTSGAQTTPRSESDIRINFWNPSKVIAASNNIGGSGRQGQYYSTDGGTTWGQTTLPLATGDSFHSDPTVDWTSDGTAWSTTLGINSLGSVLKLRVYKSTDGGATWTFDTTASGTQSSVDKQMVWVDHSATSAFKDYIYAIWHNGTPAYMNRRTAGAGGTWGTQVQVSGAESTGTCIGSDVKTNSSGDVFGFWATTGNSKVVMVKSTNGGTSYSTPKVVATMYDSYDIGIPAFNNRRALIYAAAGTYRNATKNLVYVTWTDLSGQTGCTAPANEPGSNTASTCKSRIWFSRSTDGGTTWSTPAKINDQPSLNDQFNQWIAVDETTGRVAVIYYDTVAAAGRKKSDVWYQTSSDDGVTWSAPFKVTTAMTDETITGADSGNQYGDYNGMSGYAGTFLPSWTDRRSNAKEEIWTAPVSENPCTPPAAPTGLTATAIGTGRIDLLWSQSAGAVEYRVYRGTTSGGPYTLRTTVTAPTTSFSDTGLAGGVTYYYVVRAFAGCESGNSNETFATAQGGTCTTQTLYSNGFETGSGMADWTKGTFVSGGSTTSWRGIQACTAQTGSKIFRYGGSSCTANYGNTTFTYAQPNGAGGIAVPAGATVTRLSFGHRRRFETNYDGGTLAVSLNGTSYTFVPASAIVSGTTYNGTIANSCPPAGAAGASVFTGVATSFSSTQVDLDAVCNAITGGTAGCAGQSVRIGFTSISDCSTNDDGWFLDNVTVTACVP